MSVESSLSTVSVVDALTRALREQILDGQWQPGATVAEVEVARRFRVSRSSAKAAVRTLVLEGLLRQEAHHAPVIPLLTAADIEDLFFVRVPLELAMVRRLCEMLDVETDFAERMIEDLQRLNAAAPDSAFVEADLGFHRALAASVGSSRLERAYSVLAGELHLCMLQTRQALGRDRIVREHRQILRAIRKGDVERGVAVAQRHLFGARAALIAIANGAQ